MAPHWAAQACPRLLKSALGCVSQEKSLLVWVDYYTRVRIQMALDPSKPSNPLSALSSNCCSISGASKVLPFQFPQFPLELGGRSHNWTPLFLGAASPEGMMTSPELLKQPSTSFKLRAMRLHCWLILNLAPTISPRYLPAGLLPFQLVPACLHASYGIRL